MTNNPVVLIFYHNCILAVAIIGLHFAYKNLCNVDCGVLEISMITPCACIASKYSSYSFVIILMCVGLSLKICQGFSRIPRWFLTRTTWQCPKWFPGNITKETAGQCRGAQSVLPRVLNFTVWNLYELNILS